MICLMFLPKRLEFSDLVEKVFFFFVELFIATPDIDKNFDKFKVWKIFIIIPRIRHVPKLHVCIFLDLCIIIDNLTKISSNSRKVTKFEVNWPTRFFVGGGVNDDRSTEVMIAKRFKLVCFLKGYLSGRKFSRSFISFALFLVLTQPFS